MKKTELNIPMLKKKRLDQILGLPIESDLKKELLELKHVHDVDHLEWVRQLIKTNLPLIKEKLERGA